MRSSVWLWKLVGFAFTSLFGTLLHFLYEWLGEPLWITPFSGVNESTFEHMKLMLWPMLIFAVIQSFFFKERADFWWIKLCGILLSLSLIPLLFYTYNGVIGKSPDLVNIAIFFISAAVAYCFELRLFKREDKGGGRERLAIFSLCLIAALFVIFTFNTPKLEIFKDPVTGSYGL